MFFWFPIGASALLKLHYNSLVSLNLILTDSFGAAPTVTSSWLLQNFSGTLSSCSHSNSAAIAQPAVIAADVATPEFESKFASFYFANSSCCFVLSLLCFTFRGHCRTEVSEFYDEGYWGRNAWQAHFQVAATCCSSKDLLLPRICQPHQLVWVEGVADFTKNVRPWESCYFHFSYYNHCLS